MKKIKTAQFKKLAQDFGPSMGDMSMYEGSDESQPNFKFRPKQRRISFRWNLPYLWDGQDESEPEILVSYYGTHEKADREVNFAGGNLIEDIQVFPLDDRGNPLPGVNPNTGAGNIYHILTDEAAQEIEEACENNFIEKGGPISKEDRM